VSRRRTSGIWSPMRYWKQSSPTTSTKVDTPRTQSTDEQARAGVYSRYRGGHTVAWRRSREQAVRIPYDYLILAAEAARMANAPPPSDTNSPRAAA
jgi:hypothetical protein